MSYLKYLNFYIQLVEFLIVYIIYYFLIVNLPVFGKSIFMSFVTFVQRLSGKLLVVRSSARRRVELCSPSHWVCRW